MTRSAVKRAILPSLLVLGGVALVVYGVGYHTTTVLVEEEIAPPPPPPEPPPFWGGPPRNGFPGPPFLSRRPPAPPPVPQKVLVKFVDPEQRLIRDVTIGGLARMDDGRIKRTYSGEGPALCPT